MPWFEGFRDKVVMVTGASSGIGQATALAFAATGARLALVARRRERLGARFLVQPACRASLACTHRPITSRSRRP